MKLSALHQSYLNRRSSNFRGLSGDSSADGSMKSQASVFWLVLHGLCCLVSLVLGFRFSRLVFFLLFSPSTTTNLYSMPFRQAVEASVFQLSTEAANQVLPVNTTTPRVVVGRHGIRIRPWPHPDPVEVMKAHRIIERVQREQRAQFGVKAPRTLIAVTPTYVRTFQTLHMTGVMHSLMLVPYDLVWIVVEAGGVTNETTSLIAKSGLRNIHVGFNERMPNSWANRHRLEAKMRLHALKIIREEKLDGIVIFVDDSNMHSMELFDEIQNVKWIGALSVGILAHSNSAEESSFSLAWKEADNSVIPVQGPACNSSNRLIGWHTFNSLPFLEKSATHIDDRGIILPRKLEWAGFVLNSRLLWKDFTDKPMWMKDLDLFDGVDDMESPLLLLNDASVVEPLGRCGLQVMLWWLRVEARSDSKFPPGWVIDPPLEITVPSKHTPWPDALPELPMSDKIVDAQGETLAVKRPGKTRRSRSKHDARNKRKHESRNAEVDISEKQTKQN
ncbi:hypothetical protein SAY87_009119 [Trapa incisa]|uniref:Glycosyltransferases n=1 Tax=Trapa incisa TaxID=236973 RepID=A0AAN7JY74_9MYRT|nr:hypothetical protein SAY87_009119 [Trapa incisa]